ncbi:MAG: DMT family transporter [Actinomycetota bacterium]
MSDAPVVSPRAKSRPRMLSTSAGSRPDAFGSTEWGLLALIACVWGSSFLWIAIGIESFSPEVVAFARVVFGVITLALFPRARRRVEREDLPRIALLGIIWQAIPLSLFPLAEQRISSALAGMINGAVPLFAALIAALMLKRIPALRQLVGLLIGFGGVLAISWPALHGKAGTLLGVGLLLIAVVLYGLSANLAVPLQQKYGSMPVLLRAELFAALCLSPFAAVGVTQSHWSWASTAAMVPLGILGTGLAFIALATLVGRAGAARGVVAIYFVPPVAILLGVVFRDEHVAPVALVGAALVIVGAYLTSRREPPADS